MNSMMNAGADRYLIAFLSTILLYYPPAIQAAPLPGQIIVHPDNPAWLVYNRDDNQDGHLDPFFLCGPGDPEGFLYRGRRRADGTRDGDQKQLIQKLIEHGGNCIYLMAVRTHGGDATKESRQNPKDYPDDLHNPWIERDPSRGLNEAILDQWEQWFTLMDKHGIVIYFFIYDDAIRIGDRLGWHLDATGNLHPGERSFIETLVNHFEHHRHLIWCIMEEAQELGPQWKLHTSKIAQAIRAADDYDHVIASHQLGGNMFFHADDPFIDQFAIQTQKDRVESDSSLRQWMLRAWREAAGRYSLNMSEDALHRDLMEGNKRSRIRHRNWITAMTGAYVMCLGMDIANTPTPCLADCQRLRDFFETTDFTDMLPNPDLPHAGTHFVLSAPTHSYVLYGHGAETKEMGLKQLPTGRYAINWYDCATGIRAESVFEHKNEGPVSWRKPGRIGTEAALYVKNFAPQAHIRKQGRQLQIRRPQASNQGQTNRVPQVSDRSIAMIQDQPVYIQLSYHDPDGGPGPYTVTVTKPPRHGTLSGAGNDKTYTPARGYVGTDTFSWKVNDGAGDSPLANVIITVANGQRNTNYFPPPDKEGGWRSLSDPTELQTKAGMQKSKLDEAFAYVQGSTKNGGLIVLRRGWLVYERYFGKGHRDALCNTGSCGKSFTSIAMGILMQDRADLFPQGLAQKVYTPNYFPAEAFPLPDPRMRDITLGQLLCFSAGIRGNNPCYVNGDKVTIDPVGPDGWQGMVDEITLGKVDGKSGSRLYSAKSLWCAPGEGWSYATASIHNVSIILRHITGMEMQSYIQKKLAQPLGWGRWTFAYKYAKRVDHTPGGGGIALRGTDMLRFGYLLLREGRWKDEQIVPMEYVHHTAKKSPWNPHYPYSLQFHVNTSGDEPDLPRDAYWKPGSGYHCIYVVPSEDLVVWKLGGRDGQYSSGDTGLPIPPHVKAAEQDRSKWKRRIDPEAAYTETLRLVLEAICE